MTLENHRRGRVFVRVETKSHRPIQRRPVPGWYQSAVPSAERRVYQILRVDLLNLRVQVHILVHASTYTTQLLNLCVRITIKEVSIQNVAVIECNTAVYRTIVCVEMRLKRTND